MVSSNYYLLIYKSQLRRSALIKILNLFVIIQLIFLSHSWAIQSPNSLKTICIGDLELTSATKDYENNARQLAIKYQITDQEILARLIFSEGLSTGCLNHKVCSNIISFKEHIFNKIGWGIALRIKNSIYDVVFKKFQFRTSFSPKMSDNKKNIFAHFFLCPEVSESYLKESKIRYEDLFQSAFIITGDIIHSKSIPSDYKKVTNFFYPKSPVFGEITPRWATDSNLIKRISNEWIKFYHVK